jgi:glutamate racemase
MTTSDSHSPHVLVLDSGIGGLSVVRAIRAAAPGLRLSYLADFAAFPYGTMAEDALIARVTGLVATAVTRLHIDAVVIACNTASTVVLETVRQRIDIPFVGVVPPVKPAGEISRARSIAVLATEATVRRRYLDDLVARFAPDCHVVRVGSPELARMAEDTVRGRPVDRDRLRAIIAPLFAVEPPVDAIVLGCTHYPFLLPDLRAIVGGDVAWCDPAPAVARRLIDVLGLDPAAVTDEENVAYATGGADAFAGLHDLLNDLGFTRHDVWSDETGDAG